MKAIGYIRVSTEDQAREGISLDNQEAKIKSYASLNDLELVEVIRDEGVSGKSLDRKGMTRLLGILDAGKVDALIVYNLDRLSRDTLDILTLMKRFEDRGVSFYSISENIERTAMGRFVTTIHAAQAQMIRDLIAEKTKDALAHKKVNGEWIGRIPYGFKIEDKKLIEDPEQIKTIQKAKRLKRAGKSIRSISKSLDMSKSVVHRLVSVNLKSIKAKYANGLAI